MTTKPTTTCPAGHLATADEHGTPVCQPCRLIATHHNTRSGEVYEWTDQDKHHEVCRDLQDQMDAAFDNQFFGGGW